MKRQAERKREERPEPSILNLSCILILVVCFLDNSLCRLYSTNLPSIFIQMDRYLPIAYTGFILCFIFLDITHTRHQ
ncbi:hypothetical protein ASPBRDRAFT_617380 [Aspergillus brasiliensis CBS 101740]|uniref:Uncharacterized protein n=1 Tax=Aspergillus brasiliensis (strain CBS 101740 / IMI 381727 / IBT 21946) TaxID=767769 RepID=A0A1L9UF58_ASPBC|nr:hypothetical protein ASPBRDRAFT_617380 [Aspergillus brasiliensis CBS 101740]